MNDAIILRAEVPFIQKQMPSPVRFIVQNTGDTVWVPGQYNLGTRDAGEIRVGLAHPVLPHESITIDGTINLDLPVGLHNITFRMVDEFVEWFGRDIVVPIHITAYPVLPPESLSRVSFPDSSTWLVGAEIFNTGPYACDHPARHRIKWQPTHDIQIIQAWMWTGAVYGTVADIASRVFRESDGTPIIMGDWDHYANPTLPSVVDLGFSHPLLLTSSDSLILEFGADSFGVDAAAHHKVVVWGMNR